VGEGGGEEGGEEGRTTEREKGMGERVGPKGKMDKRESPGVVLNGHRNVRGENDVLVFWSTEE